MIRILKIIDSNEKAKICSSILMALPAWFAIRQAVIDYSEGSKSLPFYAVFKENTAVGFVALEHLKNNQAGIYVMGILENYHRQGIGKQLMNICTNFCKENRIKTLLVKTLDESINDVYYNKTREFYKAMGFFPFKINNKIWGKENPCLIMKKEIL